MDPITGTALGILVGEILKDAALIIEEIYVDNISQDNSHKYNVKDLCCEKWYNNRGWYGDHSLTA